MNKHLKFDWIWVENRFRHRKRMTGAKLYTDPETGYKATPSIKGFTVEKKKTFLHRFKSCSNIKAIARSLYLDVQTIYDHIAMDDKFREEFKRLDEFDNKTKNLNSALLERHNMEKEAMLQELAQKASKYL